MVPTFTSARELFEAARDAIRDNERTRRILDTMESREGLRGHALTATGHAHGTADPMRATDARMDAEAAYHRRMADNWELIDLANALLYGRQYDGKGGVGTILDNKHADALYWWYLSGEPQKVATRVMGLTQPRILQLNRESFDTLDAYGLARALDGVGMAEDAPPDPSTD